MGSENPNPLDELKSLDAQVERISELSALQPIYFRVDEISKEYSGDFEVQLLAGDVKQHLVNRGALLKKSPPLPAAPAPPSEPRPPLNWKRPLLLGTLLGSIASVLLIVIVVNQARKRNLGKEPAPAPMQVVVNSAPAGASIRINGDIKCVAPCQIALAPGSYQVTGFLDGYDPAASAIQVVSGQPSPPVNLTFTPQAQALRILTDLDRGQVVFDNQPPAELQEGQFLLDSVAPGPHTVKITGKNSEASFAFQIAEAQQPVVTGPIAARNLMGLIVASLGSKARVVTSSGPMKLALNGQPEGDASPGGVDLTGFQPGVDEIVAGDGKDARNVKENFGPGPALTAFFKSDLNIGTLIVSTGQDGATVFINDKPYRRRTTRGQLRIPAIGKVAVRVAKDGFEIVPVQTAEVKKGDEVRLEFNLKALPTFATLEIHGGTPGAQVLIDQASMGVVGIDGNFTDASVQPGDRTVELRRDRFIPKRLPKSFKAGRTVAIAGADSVLAAAIVDGTIKLARNPANAVVTYRRVDEQQSRPFQGNQADLPAGGYIFTSKASGYLDRTDRVQLGAGETHAIEIALARIPAPAPKPSGIGDFADPGAWSKEGELWVHKGGGFVPYRLGPTGVYTFTVELVKGRNLFKEGRIRWCVQYLDSRNYLLYELDRRNFWAEVVEKGKKFERQKVEHGLDKQKAFTIQIEITKDHAIQRIRGGDRWVTLDSFSEPGRDFTKGKFGFLIQGGEEIGISDFTFLPK
ncbi:MAG: PEGA domain-containing protein [Bryobacteraceae bacterium]